MQLADKTNNLFTQTVSFISAADFRGMPKLFPSEAAAANNPPPALSNNGALINSGSHHCRKSKHFISV